MKKLLFLCVMVLLPLNANALSPVISGNWIDRAILLCKPHKGIYNIIFIDNLIFTSNVVLTCVDGKQFKQ